MQPAGPVTARLWPRATVGEPSRLACPGPRCPEPPEGKPLRRTQGCREPGTAATYGRGRRPPAGPCMAAMLGRGSASLGNHGSAPQDAARRLAGKDGAADRPSRALPRARPPEEGPGGSVPGEAPPAPGPSPCPPRPFAARPLPSPGLLPCRQGRSSPRSPFVTEAQRSSAARGKGSSLRPAVLLGGGDRGSSGLLRGK